MEFVYDDGGRSNYFKGKNVGDCVTRAICNATGKDYKEVYDRLFILTKTRRPSKRERKYKSDSPRNGVFTRVAKKYIEKELGWIWVPCMGIGTGCLVHLDPEELPKNGNLILNLSRHFSCLKDGVLYDTYDCSRDGSRCVYGYWKAPTKEQVEERRLLKEAKELESQYAVSVKEGVKQIEKSYSKKLKKLEDKVKKAQHELKLEQNRMKREIEKYKEDKYEKNTR